MPKGSRLGAIIAVVVGFASLALVAWLLWPLVVPMLPWG